MCNCINFTNFVRPYETGMKISFDPSLPRDWFERLSFLEEATRPQDIEILTTDFYRKITAEVLDTMPNLRLITQFGVGYDNIDVATCHQRGILVANTPQPVIEPTAELCMALIFGIARRTAELDQAIRANKVEFGLLRNLGSSLYGKTLGIIGMGNIGRSVARRAIACGMTIIYHNRKPVPDEVLRACGIDKATYVSQDELLTTADFVSLNLPYSADVHHIIGERELRRMKPTAFLINTARGAHVDEEALIVALQHGTIAGAALDVYEHEPSISDGLKTLPNVLLVPHIGTGTWEGRRAMCDAMIDNIIAFVNGEQDKMTLV